jgi:hypothetical protein
VDEALRAALQSPSKKEQVVRAAMSIPKDRIEILKERRGGEYGRCPDVAAGPPPSFGAAYRSTLSFEPTRRSVTPAPHGVQGHGGVFFPARRPLSSEEGVVAQKKQPQKAAEHGVQV